MGLSIKRIKDQDTVKMWTADKKVFLAGDGKTVVPEGHKTAAFLRCVPGQRIPYAEAVELGLAAPEAKASAPVEDKSLHSKVEDKGLIGRVIDAVKGD